MNPAELKTLILAEWAKGKSALKIATTLGLTEGRVAGIISYNSGPEFQKANREHYQNRAAKSAFRPRKLTRANADREARVLALWAEGRVASEIGDEIGVSRNAIIGIVHRSRGADAEAAKLAHCVTPGQKRASLSPPRQRFPHPKPAPALAGGARLKRVLSQQELAAQKAKAMAAQQAAIARVELKLIDNLAFVRVEKAWDPYAHMRSDRNYHAALAALSRPATHEERQFDGT